MSTNTFMPAMIVVIFCFFLSVCYAQSPDNPFENVDLQLVNGQGPDGPNVVWSANFLQDTFTFSINHGESNETGNYSVSHDSLFIHILESDIIERENKTITTTWWQLYPGDYFYYYITNAQLLTRNVAVHDTMFVTPLTVGVGQEKTWKEIKELFE